MLTKKEILAAVVSRLEKGSEEEEDQKNPNELQGEEQNLNFMSIVIIIVIVKEMYQGQYLMAMAGARAVVAQGRLTSHHHHHPLEEEKLVVGAEVVAGVAGSEERLDLAEMVGVDHDHYSLEEEKLVAGAGAEGCVEGLVTFFADLPCRQLKKPHSRPLLGVVACNPVVASAWRAALEDVMLHLHPPRLLLRYLPQGVFDPHR